jgi:hypothetical protein
MIDNLFSKSKNYIRTNVLEDAMFMLAKEMDIHIVNKDVHE